jgi:hypothetical protein
MIKVEKTTLIEMNVQFTEKVNIASQRFLSAKIKPTSDINNDSRTKTTSGSTSEGGAASEKNV